MNNNNQYDAVYLAQQLIKFDTTNGVVPEKACIEYIKKLLDDINIETRLVYRDELRPNLIARYPSKSPDTDIPPFVMYGHVDVVSTEDQQWDRQPFSGEIVDGYLWGRGAIDMKGQHGMFLETMLRLATEEVNLPFDVYYIAVSDEEGSSDYGMKFLIENHPEIFKDMRFAIGEIGGFSINISGKKLYPIQIAEKQVAEIKITARGKGGHASMKHSDTAMERMAAAITKLSTKRLPVRITPPVRFMMESMSEIIGGATGKVIKLLLNPKFTDKVLGLLGSAGELFDPLLHNSLNVTVVNGGHAVNVIPSAVWCKCDLRLVPQCTIEDAVKDIQSLIGNEFEIEVINYDKGMDDVDLTIYDSLAQSLKKADPTGHPVPFVLAAVTDARFLGRIGVQSYGFTPMDLPEDYAFTELSHNANERVPVSAIEFGAKIIYDYVVNDYRRNF